MTQKCKHDEQLLDYVYGELSDAERKTFAEHLVSCSACLPQVESFAHIRQEFHQRPPTEPAFESMQRMTALLMQAAAEQGATAGGTAVDGDGGKVLAFRSRGLRRLLFHPAGGVMAVAAAALFWVVFRAQPPQSGGPAPAPSTLAFEAPRGSAGAPPPVTAPPPGSASKTSLSAPADKVTDVVVGGSKQEPASREGRLARPSDRGAATDTDFAGLRAQSKAWPEGKSALPGPRPMAPSTPAAKPSAVASLDPRGPAGGAAAAGKGGGIRSRDSEGQSAPSNSGPAVVAMADQAYEKSAKKEARFEAERPAERWAQPPPAEPPPPVQAAPAAPPVADRPAKDQGDASVRGALARTQEQRKQKVVDELTNQELGGLATGATVGAPAAAPPNQGSYAQHLPSSASQTKADTGASQLGNRAMASEAEDGSTPAASPATPVQGLLGRGAVSGSRPDDGAAALTAVKEQLRRGQCAEANAALAKLARTLPATRDLAETRAEWQSACAAPNQQLLERRLPNYEAPEPAASQAGAPRRSVNKTRVAFPSPSPAKPVSRAKAVKAPDRGNANAADVAY